MPATNQAVAEIEEFAAVKVPAIAPPQLWELAESFAQLECAAASEHLRKAKNDFIDPAIRHRTTYVQSKITDYFKRDT